MKYKRTDALSLWHQHRAPRWTFMDPCKPEVRPGAREESASPAWLAAPTMNARDTKKVYIYGGLTLDVDRHYIGSVTATTHQEKGIITLDVIVVQFPSLVVQFPSRGTVLLAPRGKGYKCDKNVNKIQKFCCKRTHGTKWYGYHWKRWKTWSHIVCDTAVMWYVIQTQHSLLYFMGLLHCERKK